MNFAFSLPDDENKLAAKFVASEAISCTAFILDITIWLHI